MQISDNQAWWIRGLVVCLVIGVALGIPLLWSSEASLRAAFGVITLDTQGFDVNHLENDSAAHAFRRNIQRHFLRHGLYIPLEDIVTVRPKEIESRTGFLMQKACGEAKLYIWVPIRFHLPFAGSKILEWCWKPSLKKT